MTARQQHCQQLFQDLLLAHDHLAHLVAKVLVRFAQTVDGLNVG
jgi:hypothetical protein